MNLRDKSVVVTGGSRGLGLGLVEALVDQGASVRVVAREAGALAAVRARLGVETIAADVTDAAAAKRILADVRPELAVMNAGATPLMGPIDQMSWEDFTHTRDTDVKAGLHWMQAALNLPLAPGSRVLVGSGGALRGAVQPAALPRRLRHAAHARAVWPDPVSRTRGQGAGGPGTAGARVTKSAPIPIQPATKSSCHARPGSVSGRAFFPAGSRVSSRAGQGTIPAHTGPANASGRFMRTSPPSLPPRMQHVTVDAPATGIIPLPDSVGALYAIPADQWHAIAGRVSAVIQAQQIAAEIQKYIPNYPALLAACTQWRGQTFQSVLTQSVQVGTLAMDMSSVLQTLQRDAAGLRDGDPVPRTIQFLFSVEFKANAEHAGLVQAGLSAIAPDVAAFVAQNQAADTSLQAIVQTLPPEWASIAGPLATLGAALPSVQNGWTDLCAQLQGLAAGTVTVTTAALLREDLVSAIAAWTRLGQSATAFVGQASALT